MMLIIILLVLILLRRIRVILFISGVSNVNICKYKGCRRRAIIDGFCDECYERHQRDMIIEKLDILISLLSNGSIDLSTFQSTTLPKGSVSNKRMSNTDAMFIPSIDIQDTSEFSPIKISKTSKLLDNTTILELKKELDNK
jgi:hypothetical protein